MNLTRQAPLTAAASVGLALVVASSAVVALVAAGDGVPKVELVRDDANRRVDVRIDGKPFTSYIWPDRLKKPVLLACRSIIRPSTVIITGSAPPP